MSESIRDLRVMIHAEDMTIIKKVRGSYSFDIIRGDIRERFNED